MPKNKKLNTEAIENAVNEMNKCVDVNTMNENIETVETVEYNKNMDTIHLLNNGVLVSKVEETTDFTTHISVCNTGNNALDQATTYIMSMSAIVKNIEYVTCSLLAFIRNNSKVFLNGSCFKSFEDYTKEMFGYNKSQAHELASIGERFVTISTNENKEYPFRIVYSSDNKPILDTTDLSNLKISVKSDKYGFRFNKTALGKMLSLTDIEIEKLINEDKIYSTMSVNQIKDIVKEIKALPVKSNDKVSKDNDSKDNDTKENVKKVEYKITTDKDVLNAMCDMANNLENVNIKNMVLDLLKRANAYMNKDNDNLEE